MKKIKILGIVLVSIFIAKTNVKAASATFGVSSNNVYVGKSFTTTVNINSAAAWNVHVSASGPVSGCTINQADATSDAKDTSKTFTATCTATAEGTITVTLSGDVTSATDGNAINLSGSRTVVVSTRPAPAPTPTPATPQTNNNNRNSNSNGNGNVLNNDVSNKSSNNNIKQISVEGYKLVKINDNNYSLTVFNDVTSINIKATAEDSKANISGVGKHDLKDGDNNIELIVTSESGIQNKINIKVTRKDGYYLEDLATIIDKNNLNNIDIIIKENDIIKSSDLEKVKNSKKIVSFNYYNDKKILLYSWIVDGSKLKKVNDIIPAISYDSENKENMQKLSNYADGLYIKLKQNKNLPEGLKLKIYVGDKFKSKDAVNVYSYLNGDKNLYTVSNNIKLKDGYIEFDIIDKTDYLITKSNIFKSTETKSSSNILLVPMIILFIIIVLLLIFIIFLIKRNKNINNKKYEDKKEETEFNKALSNNTFSLENNLNNNITNDIIDSNFQNEILDSTKSNTSDELNSNYQQSIKKD